MLIIRDEQIKIFEEAALQKFEDEMVRHIKKFAPQHFESLGDDVIRQVVQMGVERTKEYELTNRGPARFFIEMMFMFGSDFDTDPQYPWAGEILNDAQITDQMDRANRLYDKMMDYMANVVGLEREYEYYALQRLRNMNLERITIPEESNEEVNCENDIVMLLKWIYPQKCEYVGEGGIRALIHNAITKVHHPFSTEGAPVLFSVLMFFLGHECFTDPQFPWIDNILMMENEVDDEEKAHLIDSKIKEHIENVMLGK